MGCGGELQLIFAKTREQRDVNTNIALNTTREYFAIIFRERGRLLLIFLISYIFHFIQLLR